METIVYWITFFATILAFSFLNYLVLVKMEMDKKYAVISSGCVFVLGLIIGGIWSFALSVLVGLAIKVALKQK